MKNKEFYKLLKKNQSKFNSGFTLTELLVGLIMSIFVIGALGFGLMQILKFTQKGNSETLVRNESSRALDFISDEMRRANAIEVKTDDTHIDTVSANYENKKKSGATVRLALRIPGVDNTTGSGVINTERIIYSVAAPEASSPWKGPLVIYRWGPNLDANGNYTDPNDSTNWKNQALADGISDVEQIADGCDMNADGNDDKYKGFFACMVDDDGDAITEDATDKNGDGVISFADDSHDKNGDGVINYGDTLVDGPDSDSDVTFRDSKLDKNQDDKINGEDGADTDGLAITAQLYFSGETKQADGTNTDTYSADTKAVARARTAPDNNADNSGGYITAFTTLDPSFSCNATTDWAMRTDFGDSLTAPSNKAKWDHETNRQPQPIETNTDTLMISSVPTGKSEAGKVDGNSNCLNRRDFNGRESEATALPEPRDFEGNKTIGSGDWYGDSSKDNVVAITHAINFNDPRTFNGDLTNCATGAYCGSNNGKVYTQRDGQPAIVNPYVLVFKNGSTIPNSKGYDMNGDDDYSDLGEQMSLRDFLHSKGLTTPDKSKIKDDALADDERVVAFEIGKYNVSDLNTRGVDFQDNVFRLRSSAFKQKYKTYTDGTHASDYYVPDIKTTQ